MQAEHCVQWTVERLKLLNNKNEEDKNGGRGRGSGRKGKREEWAHVTDPM